jgi:hypothetical protein
MPSRKLLAGMTGTVFRYSDIVGYEVLSTGIVFAFHKLQIVRQCLLAVFEIVDDVDLFADDLEEPDGRQVAIPQIPGGVSGHVFVIRHIGDKPLILQKTKPALKSSNLNREASFANGSFVKTIFRARADLSRKDG